MVIKMHSLLRELLNKFSNVIASNCEDSILKTLKGKSELVRQSTRAQYGDICIPRGVVILAFPTPQQVECVRTSILSVSESLLPVPILSCSACENGFISIRLHRPATFKRVIGDVVRRAERYGHCEDEKPARMTAVVASLPTESCPEGEAREERTSLSSLRQHLLHQHVSALLEANGYQDILVDRLTSAALDKILGGGRPDHTSQPFTLTGETQGIHPKISREVWDSKFVSSVGCQTDRMAEGSESDTGWRERAPGPSGSSVRPSPRSDPSLPCGSSMDLLEVVKDQQLRVGKGGYSQNLSGVQLTNHLREPTALLQECSKLQHALDKVNTTSSADTVHVLHIAPSSQEFRLQQLDLTIRGLSEDFRCVRQFHLPCAPVSVTAGDPTASESTSGKEKGRGKKAVDAEEFYAIRESQMREASVMKYGDQVKGETWNSMIQTLTAAGIKFDILGTHFRHTVKLDVGFSQESNPWRDNRNGVFVVYNYARLANIFARFEEDVQKGTYPPLPPLDNVDFSTLREDIEWKLLFSHVLNLPDVVASSLEDGFTIQGCCCNFETQKVCRFLISLSQDLSAYYSRFRILVEPRPHLLPTIQARLYLLKAVHQVLANGLALLRITPLSQM